MANVNLFLFKKTSAVNTIEGGHCIKNCGNLTSVVDQDPDRIGSRLFG